MELSVPRNGTVFDVTYDPTYHNIEVTVGGEDFDTAGLMIDASAFGGLNTKIVTLYSYLLEAAYEKWLEEDGPQSQRDADLEAASDARAER